MRFPAVSNHMVGDLLKESTWSINVKTFVENDSFEYFPDVLTEGKEIRE